MSRLRMTMFMTAFGAAWWPPVVAKSVQDQTDVRRPLRAADDHVSQVVIRILTVEQVVVADLMAPWLSGERDANPARATAPEGHQFTLQ